MADRRAVTAPVGSGEQSVAVQTLIAGAMRAPVRRKRRTVKKKAAPRRRKRVTKRKAAPRRASGKRKATPKQLAALRKGRAALKKKRRARR